MNEQLPTHYTVSRIDWNSVPPDSWGGIHRYISAGILPGDFLTAIISNDLKESYARADDVNVHYIRNYVMFFYQYAPTPCWGSRANVKAWVEMGGLRGLMNKETG